MPTRRNALTTALGGVLAATGLTTTGLLAARTLSGTPSHTPARELRHRGVPGTVTLPELAEDLGFLGHIHLKRAETRSTRPGSPSELSPSTQVPPEMPSSAPLHSPQVPSPPDPSAPEIASRLVPSTPDSDAVAAGEIDFGSVANDVIVRLRAAGVPLTAVIACHGTDKDNYQGFYVLRRSPVRTARDLIGRRIGIAAATATTTSADTTAASATTPATPTTSVSATIVGGTGIVGAWATRRASAEAATQAFLAGNGLTPAGIERVTLVEVPAADIEQWLRSGRVDVAVLDGPPREPAGERSGFRVLYTDFEVLGAYSDGSHVFRDDFIAAHPETVRTFTTGVARALEWSRTQPREAVLARFTEIIAKRARGEDDSSLKHWRSYGVATRGGAITDVDFSTWIERLGGTPGVAGLTAADLYTNDFNGVARGEAG